MLAGGERRLSVVLVTMIATWTTWQGLVGMMSKTVTVGWAVLQRQTADQSMLSDYLAEMLMNGVMTNSGGQAM